MHRSFWRLFLVAGLSVLVAVMALPRYTNAAPARDNTITLTVMTNSYMMAGLTKASMSSTNSIASWYRYYGALWNKYFPNVKIHEIYVASPNQNVSPMSTEATKTILAVNAGDPPDLVGTDQFLGTLVARHAVMNLDPFYKAAGITPSYFLPAMANYARTGGHWYAMPGASGPSENDILYIPQLVKAAGLDPNNIPDTWDGLWAATQKVTKWDSKGNLVRIGLPADTSTVNIASLNQFCGYWAAYDPTTQKFHANLPCIKDYFRFELRLVKFYGGVTAYNRFMSGDPLVWSCSKKAYYPTGKILFGLDAYWAGGQMDTCYNANWALSWAPTQHGTPAERRGLTTANWLMLIPKGARHPQLAFDFIKFTIWEHGYLMGPTTNGYVKVGQGTQWADTFDKVEAQIRAKNHYEGNPMAVALAKVVIPESKIGEVGPPNDVANGYYDEQMNRAWQQMEYGRASVDQALDQVQELVDTQQRVLHAQAGI